MVAEMKECFFHIQNGEIANKKIVKNCFSDLNDGKYYLKIQSSQKRSLKQSAYLHGVVIPLVFEGLRNVGFDDVRDNEDAKLIIKELFLKRKIENKNTGEVITIVRQTRDLTALEMNQFIEDVAKWCSEYLGFVLPMPNQQMVLYEENNLTTVTG